VVLYCQSSPFAGCPFESAARFGSGRAGVAAEAAGHAAAPFRSHKTRSFKRTVFTSEEKKFTHSFFPVFSAFTYFVK
jgi:hypothetical protein